jgi:hypothetical protein
MRNARFLGRLAVVSSLAWLLAGCTIDPKKVEQSIRDTFEADDVEIDSIECPKNEKMKEGAKFECEGTSGLGDSFVVKVKQTDGSGTIKWELEGRIMDPKEVAKKTNGLVDCGKKKFIAVKGTKMKCKEGGAEVTYKFTDDEGKFEVAR